MREQDDITTERIVIQRWTIPNSTYTLTTTTCDCGQQSETDHCLYMSELYGEFEKCNCCEFCQQECLDDI